MMNALIALGMGIIIFALIAGVGMVILQNFASATASCSTGFNYSITSQLCQNNTNATHTASPSTGAQTVNTTAGYITSNLVTWIPAVIALGVGLLFIGALMGRQQAKY